MPNGSSTSSRWFTGRLSSLDVCAIAPTHHPSSMMKSGDDAITGHCSVGKGLSVALSKRGSKVRDPESKLRRVSNANGILWVPGTPRVASNGCTFIASAFRCDWS